MTNSTETPENTNQCSNTQEGSSTLPLAEVTSKTGCCKTIDEPDVRSVCCQD